MFSGSLPSCLWQPKSSTNSRPIKSLLLGKNRFSGSLPNETNLPNLVDLFLQSNNFSGSIPQSFLKSMTSLQYVDLSYNSFSLSTVPDLDNLKNLSYIEFSNCNLTGPLPELYEKQSLIQFSASNNRLSSTLPSSFSNSTTLQVLSLYNNR